ncbi:MAG: hypothetical protein U0703_16075 [Anaerolineae bacterium]
MQGIVILGAAVYTLRQRSRRLGSTICSTRACSCHARADSTADRAGALVIAAPLLARRPDAHRSGEPATAAQRRPPAGNRPAGARRRRALYGGRHTLLIAALATLIGGRAGWRWGCWARSMGQIASSPC